MEHFCVRGIDTLWNVCRHYWDRPAELRLEDAGEARKGVEVLRKYTYIRRKRRSLGLSTVASAGSMGHEAPANGYPHTWRQAQRAPRHY